MAGETGWSKNGSGKSRRSSSRAWIPARCSRCRKIHRAGFSEKRPGRVLPTITEMTFIACSSLGVCVTCSPLRIACVLGSPSCDPALRPRYQLAEDCRNQLAHGRVDTDPALHNGVGEVPIHCVHQGVHDLITADAEDSGAQNLIALCVHQHLHEPLGFTSFASARDLRHWHLAD